MRYNNTYWLHYQISPREAAVSLFNGIDVYGLPACGCPVPPDPVRIKATEFSTGDDKAIELKIMDAYSSFAKIV